MKIKNIHDSARILSGGLFSVRLPNGVLRFFNNEVELLPFWPGYPTDVISPISFVANATCNRFLNELVRPAVCPDDVDLLQRFVGQILLGKNICGRLLVVQKGRSLGKTTFMNVISGLIGSENTAVMQTNRLASPFELARFAGKTLLVGAHVDLDFLKAKYFDVIKGLVGGGTFSYRQKSCKTFSQMRGDFNIIIQADSGLRYDRLLWSRRLAVVPFDGCLVTKPICDFSSHLLNLEGSGILNWAIAGAQKLLSEAAFSGDIVLTPKQQDRVSK